MEKLWRIPNISKNSNYEFPEVFGTLWRTPSLMLGEMLISKRPILLQSGHPSTLKRVNDTLGALSIILSQKYGWEMNHYYRGSRSGQPTRDLARHLRAITSPSHVSTSSGNIFSLHERTGPFPACIPRVARLKKSNIDQGFDLGKRHGWAEIQMSQEGLNVPQNLLTKHRKKEVLAWKRDLRPVSPHQHPH